MGQKFHPLIEIPSLVIMETANLERWDGKLGPCFVGIKQNLTEESYIKEPPRPYSTSPNEIPSSDANEHGNNVSRPQTSTTKPTTAGFLSANDLFERLEHLEQKQQGGKDQGQTQTRTPPNSSGQAHRFDPVVEDWVESPGTSDAATPPGSSASPFMSPTKSQRDFLQALVEPTHSNTKHDSLRISIPEFSIGRSGGGYSPSQSSCRSKSVAEGGLYSPPLSACRDLEDIIHYSGSDLDVKRMEMLLRRQRDEECLSSSDKRSLEWVPSLHEDPWERGCETPDVQCPYSYATPWTPDSSPAEIHDNQPYNGSEPDRDFVTTHYPVPPASIPSEIESDPVPGLCRPSQPLLQSHGPELYMKEILANLKRKSESCPSEFCPPEHKKRKIDSGEPLLESSLTSTKNSDELAKSEIGHRHSAHEPIGNLARDVGQKVRRRSKASLRKQAKRAVSSRVATARFQQGEDPLGMTQRGLAIDNKNTSDDTCSGSEKDPVVLRERAIKETYVHMSPCEPACNMIDPSIKPCPGSILGSEGPKVEADGIASLSGKEELLRYLEDMSSDLIEEASALRGKQAVLRYLEDLNSHLIDHEKRHNAAAKTWDQDAPKEYLDPSQGHIEKVRRVQVRVPVPLTASKDQGLSKISRAKRGKQKMKVEGKKYEPYSRKARSKVGSATADASPKPSEH